MLKIRLARIGRKKLAHYRVVVSDSRRTPTGGFVEQLGHFNPHTKELSVNVEKTQKYLDNGTQISSRLVRVLQERDDIRLPDWAKENLVVKAEKPAEEPYESASEEKAKDADEKVEDGEQSSDSDQDEEAAEEEEASAQDAPEAQEDDKTADTKKDDKAKEGSSDKGDTEEASTEEESSTEGQDNK